MNTLDCLEEIYKNLGFNENYYVKDDKLYESVDMGHHTSYYEERLKSEDCKTVELFNACKVLYNYFKFC